MNKAANRATIKHKHTPYHPTVGNLVLDAKRRRGRHEIHSIKHRIVTRRILFFLVEEPFRNIQILNGDGEVSCIHSFPNILRISGFLHSGILTVWENVSILL